MVRFKANHRGILGRIDLRAIARVLGRVPYSRRLAGKFKSRLGLGVAVTKRQRPSFLPSIPRQSVMVRSAARGQSLLGVAGPIEMFLFTLWWT
jgi:hypothetical protein